MTKPKISDKQAQTLLEVVRYTLDVHEWCEQPPHDCGACGHRHYMDCDGDDVNVCEGCSMRRKAEAAAKWRAAL